MKRFLAILLALFLMIPTFSYAKSVSIVDPSLNSVVHTVIYYGECWNGRINTVYKGPLTTPTGIKEIAKTKGPPIFDSRTGEILQWVTAIYIYTDKYNNVHIPYYDSNIPKYQLIEEYGDFGACPID